MSSLSYKDLVNYLLDVASGITNESGYTMEYTDFGFDYEIGLNDQTVGRDWKYPACFIIPSDTSHRKNSELYFNFTITLINQIKKDKSDRLEIYDKLMTWAIAFVQYLDQYLTVEYDLNFLPVDINYDSESIGWSFDISILSYFDCLLDDTGGPTGTGPIGGYIGSGTSGTSGVDGNVGTDGTSGTSGVDGTFFGTSGVDGTSGTSGVDGTFFGSSGVDGTSGTSGVSGTSGTSGVSGTSGTSGVSGTDGTSGVDGEDGVIGSSGVDGTSGTSGVSGTDGTSGVDGTSGTSGVSGTDGTSGVSGTDGTSGVDGEDGVIGSSGVDGTSGTSGVSGTDGTSGVDGTSGTSGVSGTDGTSGVDGTDGTSGLLPELGNNTEILYRDTGATYGYNTSTGFTFNNNTIHINGTGLTSNEPLGSGSGLIGVPALPGATYKTSQNTHSLFASAGSVNDGYITDGGGGTINVASGSGFIKATDVDTAQLISFDWDSVNGIPIPTDTVRFVGVEYNSGSPRVVTGITEYWDHDTEFSLGSVVNEDGDLHIFDNPWETTDAFSHTIERFAADNGKISRDNEVGGLVIGESGDGNRYVTLTGGRLWSRFNKVVIDDIDTSISGNFHSYYRDGSPSGWAQITGTTWDNVNYDNGSGTLEPLSNNQYTNLWWYIGFGNELHMIYGQGEYANSATAEAVSPPANVPNVIEYGSILIGRFIIQQGETTAIQIQSSFSTQFTAALAAYHGNLSGLIDDDHPQYLLYERGGETIGDIIYWDGADWINMSGFTDGTSGTSGVSGTSGTSGVDGTDGTSGVDGTSGTSGVSGTDGTSGVDGTDGTSGTDGSPGSIQDFTVDNDFYYDTTNDRLYTPKINISNNGVSAIELYDVVTGTKYNLYISSGTLTINTA